MRQATVSAGDAATNEVVDDEQATRQDAWTTLFQILGIIPQQDERYTVVESVIEGDDQNRVTNLVVNIDEKDPDELALLRAQVESKYEKLRRALSVEAGFSHSLVEGERRSPASGGVSETALFEDLKITSGFDVLNRLFGKQCSIGDAIGIDWQSGFEEYEKISGSGSGFALVTKEPVAALFKPIYEEIFRRIINLLSGMSPAELREVLATKDRFLDISHGIDKFEGDQQGLMIQRVIGCCFDFTTDGRAFCDFTVLLALLYLPKMKNLSIPARSLVDYLAQQIPSKAVVDPALQKLLLLPRALTIASHKSIIILADNTASIERGCGRYEYLDALEKRIMDSIKIISKGDEVVVCPFGGHGIVGSPKTFACNATLKDVRRYVNSMKLDEDTTPLYGAIKQVLDMPIIRAKFEDPNGQVALIVFTDGKNNVSVQGCRKMDLDETLKVPCVDPHAFVVGIGPEHDKGFCAQLARETGGKYIDATDSENMRQIDSCLNEMRSLRELFELAAGRKVAVYDCPVSVPMSAALSEGCIQINGHVYHAVENPQMLAGAPSAPHSDLWSQPAPAGRNQAPSRRNSCEF